MPTNRTDIWTILLITVVTFMIWYAAAGATRMTDEVPVTIDFVVPDNWSISPESQTVNLEIVGSASAVRRAVRESAIHRLTIEPTLEKSDKDVDLLAMLASHPEFERAAISIERTDPPTIKLTIDPIVTEQVRVRRSIRGATVETISVQPAQVNVSMPQSMRENRLQPLLVEPVLDQDELDTLEPGRAHQLDDVRLRLVNFSGASDDITIDPATVQVSFELESRTQEMVLERPVRILSLTAPEDTGGIVFDPEQLPQVTVSGPSEVIDGITRGDTRVVAVVVLKSTERAARLDRKRVSHFVAELADGTARTIEAWVGATKDRNPEVTITYPLDEEPGA